jgi:hypothetical protein
MPIRRPELYPRDWPFISDRIRFQRAKRRCECDGRCKSSHHTAGGRCPAKHGLVHPAAQYRVVLTVAHLDRDPRNNRDDNLMAMCQSCHLAYDSAQHLEATRRTVRARYAIGDLFQ